MFVLTMVGCQKDIVMPNRSGDDVIDLVVDSVTDPDEDEDFEDDIDSVTDPDEDEDFDGVEGSDALNS